MEIVGRTGRAFATTVAAVALAGGGAFGLMITQAGAAHASTPAHTNDTNVTPPRCTTSQLSAHLDSDKGGGTAGNVHGTLSLTNTGSIGCTLYGFPGVSFVTGDSGRQVGAPATRLHATREGMVVLPPGAVALAKLNQHATGAFPDCQETSTRGFRVYPPNQKAALFVADPGRGCANEEATVLAVGPVVPGSGSSYANSSAQPTPQPGDSQQGGEGTQGNGQVSRVPKGAVDAGGGATAGIEDPWLFGAGGAAALAAGGVATMAIRRRHAGEH